VKFLRPVSGLRPSCLRSASDLPPTCLYPAPYHLSVTNRKHPVYCFLLITSLLLRFSAKLCLKTYSNNSNYDLTSLIFISQLFPNFANNFTTKLIFQSPVRQLTTRQLVFTPPFLYIARMSPFSFLRYSFAHPVSCPYETTQKKYTFFLLLFDHFFLIHKWFFGVGGDILFTNIQYPPGIHSISLSSHYPFTFINK
jgi:hypothetical protein